MQLLDKGEVLYFEPESIGSADGARCGACWKFNRFANSCVEVDGTISSARGICGLYVNGEPIGSQLYTASLRPARKISKSEAGYSEQGPTHCGNCMEMVVPQLYGTSPCKEVVGLVDGRACCNAWKRK